ncbi:DM13 domain-containing protein [Candidatus Woesearchaeota archaeon]|nr:DM13 domain-containing protein [Candidatus Woesearchaeota archaeon]
MHKNLLLIMLLLFSVIFLSQGCSSNKNTLEQIPVVVPESEQPSFVPAENGNVVIVQQTTTVSPSEQTPAVKENEAVVYSAKVPASAPKRQILRRGSFQPKTHPVEGNLVMYYSDDEKITGTDEETLLVLELTNDFSSAYGPDLHVYISTILDLDQAHIFEEGEFADLGSLKELSGRQYYVVSDYAKTLEYNSVVIYAPGYNEVYGVAYLY